MKLTKDNSTKYIGDFCLWYEPNTINPKRRYWIEIVKTFETEKEMDDYFKENLIKNV